MTDRVLVRLGVFLLNVAAWSKQLEVWSYCRATRLIAKHAPSPPPAVKLRPIVDVHPDRWVRHEGRA